MNWVIKYGLAVIVLFLGIPIGDILKKYTKEELKVGRPWFKLIVLVSLFGGLVGVITGNDAIMFGFFFMAIVTSRSLIEKTISKKPKEGKSLIKKAITKTPKKIKKPKKV